MISNKMTIINNLKKAKWSYKALYIIQDFFYKDDFIIDPNLYLKEKHDNK